MGVVWMASSLDHEGVCALKILNLRQRQGSAERSFNREVRAMARLTHPNIAQILDYGRCPAGAPFMAMEYVPGSPLHDYMRGAWSWPQLWNLLEGLLAALAHAHARDLFHRDLKPGNVLLLPRQTGPGSVKLLDFGIALALTDTAQAARRIEGTPAYIAPEAASGEVAVTGPWTDLYSLGVILFEILSGDLPFHGRHLLSHHQRSPLPPLSVRPEVEAPAELGAIIRKLLEKSPQRRFRSVTALRETLEPLRPPQVEAVGEAPRLLSLLEEDESPSKWVIRRSPGPGLFHLRQPPMVGREQAQKLLCQSARAVLDQGKPRVLLIEAEAGFGKTRLSSWLRSHLEESGRMRSLVFESEPQSTGQGFRRAILRFIGAPTAQEDRAAEVLEAAFSQPETRSNAQSLLWGSLGDGGVKDQELKRAARLIRDLSEGQPLLLLAEDVHWSPEGRVLRLIHRLARSPLPLLLVATLRPSSRSTVQAARRALLNLNITQKIELGALSPLHLAPALNSLGPLPEGLAEAASIQAAGCPLLALEAVRSYLEAEGLSSAPTDPHRVIQERIHRASLEQEGRQMRDLLARATLLGRSFSLKPLLKLAAVPGEEPLPSNQEGIEALLERGVSAGFLAEQGVRRWTYFHDLVRVQFRSEARHLSCWPALNLKAAELKMPRARVDSTGIEMEVVARHRWAGGALVQALRMGMKSALKLHSAGLMGHASSFIRRLLSWDDRTQLLSAEDRGELRLLGSDAAEHAGQPHEAEKHALAAVKIAKRNYLHALGARAASHLGSLKLLGEAPEEAEPLLWDALRFARTSQDPKARARAHYSLGQFYQQQEKLELARQAFEASLESARSIDLKADELAARQALARIDRLQERPMFAAATLEALLREAQEESLEVLALECRLQLGLCAWMQGDSEVAQEAFAEVHQGARGNLFALEFFSCLGEAWAQACERRWSAVEGLLIQAEELRYDVRLKDPEAEQIRLDLRELALASRRSDIVGRLDNLEGSLTRTHSTHASV